MNLSENFIPVAASFVFCDDGIAFIKCSNRVDEYRNQWDGFSGFIEQLPIEQAYIELEEKAGLKKDMLLLRGIGIPLPVSDESIGKNWLLFVFLFEIHDKSLIKPNCEPQQIKWVKPHDIPDMDTVPGLYDGLLRVWPPSGSDKFWGGLAEIAGNRTNGATSLARKGLETLAAYVSENQQSIDRYKLMKAVRAYAAVRPSMGVFPNLAARLMLGMEREDSVEALIDSLIAAMNDSTELSVANAALAVSGKRKVFTLSDGEAVRKTLLKWNAPGCEVIAAESFPGSEGINLAEYLSTQGINVRVVKDKCIREAAAEADVVLVGCDAITSDNCIQNKVGTRIAIEAGNDFGIPTYAVTQTFKITPSSWPSYIEHVKDKSGLLPVFDHTPIEMFTSVCTENGELTINELNKLRNELDSIELIPSKNLLAKG